MDLANLETRARFKFKFDVYCWTADYNCELEVSFASKSDADEYIKTESESAALNGWFAAPFVDGRDPMDNQIFFEVREFDYSPANRYSGNDSFDSLGFDEKMIVAGI